MCIGYVVIGFGVGWASVIASMLLGNPLWVSCLLYGLTGSISIFLVSAMAPTLRPWSPTRLRS